MAEVLPIETPTLGDRSYLVHDGEVAVVIDPQRDTDRITALAGQEGVRITHVAETHIHNDYVSGGLALARATGAAYLVNGADPVRFARLPVADGDVIQVGPAIRLRVVATPGHTLTHLSYVLESAGQVAGVFTGGSLLFGSTGRPDLLGPENTGRLARAQHASARRLARELPDSAQIFPTHGFGSFCAATQAQATASTIGREKQVNPALTLGEQAYIETLLAGLDAYPAYYAHMGRRTWPARAGRTCPRPDAPTRRRSAAGSRPASGWSTCGTGSRSRPASCRGHSASPWTAASRATWAGSALGHPAHPARRDTAAGGAGPAGTGPDRHRPPGRRGGRAAGAVVRRPAAGDPAAGQVRRPGRGRPAATRWCWMCGATWSGRAATSRGPCTSRSASFPAGSVRSRRARCGFTAGPATDPRWPPRSWRPPAAGWSASMTSSTTPKRRADPHQERRQTEETMR